MLKDGEVPVLFRHNKLELDHEHTLIQGLKKAARRGAAQINQERI
jgi:hypothetical protein